MAERSGRGAEADEQAPSRIELIRRRYPSLDRLVRAAEHYLRQYGDHYAAAITYFSVLALVPLLMIAFSVAGLVLGGNPDLLARLRTSISNAVPNPQLSALLHSVIEQAISQSGAVGIIGLLVALYSGLSWMTNLREALTEQWGQPPSSLSFLKRTLADLVALIGLGVAMAVSFGLSALGGGVGRMLFGLTGIRNELVAQIVLTGTTIVLALAANWLVFLWVLARLPRQPVPLRSAVWGALFAAVGFEVLKQVGVVYLNSVTGSPAGAAFGPILGLLVFVFLSSRFILFVTAWTACAPENVQRAVPEPPGPAVIRPIVQVRERTSTFAKAALFGLGVVAGWLWRRH